MWLHPNHFQLVKLWRVPGTTVSRLTGFWFRHVSTHSGPQSSSKSWIMLDRCCRCLTKAHPVFHPLTTSATPWSARHWWNSPRRAHQWVNAPGVSGETGTAWPQNLHFDENFARGLSDFRCLWHPRFPCLEQEKVQLFSCSVAYNLKCKTHCKQFVSTVSVGC